MVLTNLAWTKRVQTLLALFLIVVGSVFIDQSTKYYAEKEFQIWSHHSNLKLYQGKRVVLWSSSEDDSVTSKRTTPMLELSLNYVRNQGAAWGIFSDVKDSIRIPFFYLVTVLAMVIILFYFRSTPYNARLVRFALALVFSGAVGNLADRLRLGYVIDFIDVRWNAPIPFIDNSWVYNFPNFNWADSCITTGVIFLMIDMVFFEQKRLQSASR